MKTFFLVWVGVILIGWVLLSLFSMFLGEMGLLLLVTLIIAALIAGFMALSNETDELRQRVKALEDAAAPKSEDADVVVTGDET